MTRIKETAPQNGPFYDHVSDYHEPVAPERYAQEVRAGYARRTPAILKAAAEGGMVGRNFMHFDWRPTPNAEQAMFSMYSEGVSLYPQYPFLHMFLPLACPWRRLAVLVEEDAAPWTPQQIADEDELLTLSGWRVFRIPAALAHTFMEDAVPEHLRQAFEHGPEDPEQQEELREAERHLPYTSIDGFFRWLRQEHFSSEAQQRYLKLHAAGPLDHISRNPWPTDEEEAARPKYPGATLGA